MLGVLGIDDPSIWMAYVLCVGVTLFCVIYALAMRNRGGEEPVTPQDRAWAAHETKVEEEV